VVIGSTSKLMSGYLQLSFWLNPCKIQGQSKAKLANEFAMIESGDLSYCLGIQDMQSNIRRNPPLCNQCICN
jgi:hypothetical protein